ncbi:MAG: hypothetical protein GXP30_07615 [Verrucomicrobia bacterium]|nr:hypothetical protein [Verrucomicrobiota bacterium]
MKLPTFLAITATCLLCMSATSCASRDGFVDTKNSLAALEIQNSTDMDIRQAVIETFLTNGYQRESAYGLIFVKKGDILRQIEYASYMGGAATMRVRVSIDPISASSHLVKVSAYTVTHQSSSFGDKEKKVRGLRKGHYRSLLREVNERLPQY